MADYDDIPGTYIFDGRRSRQGYHLNMFCMSLNSAENRAAFADDPNAYLTRFSMSDAQRQAVVSRDYLEMLRLGGNIYYTFKIAICDGRSMQYVGADMSGMTEDGFRQMMIDGGRSIEGNRYESERGRG